MIKTTLSSCALAVALSAAPAMAADFHALAGLQATPAPLQDGVLAATEGGSACTAGAASVAGGLVDNAGVALCASLPTILGIFANFAVFNAAPVTGAQFLQVTGF